MATNPPTPPTAADLPPFTKSKLNAGERALARNAVEPIQTWVKANDGALKARGHFYLDEAIRWLQSSGHGWVDKGITRVRDTVLAIRF